MRDKQRARQIVQTLLRDMLNRRGFRQNWDGIDGDIRKQILAAWEAIVLAGLTPMVAELAALRALLRQALDCTCAAGDARHAEYCDWRVRVIALLASGGG